MSEATGGYIIPGKNLSNEDFQRIRNAIQDYFSGTTEVKEGWPCPRCGKVNAPDVKQCDCKSPRLPHTIVEERETK